ncbi:MAG: carbohydrate ABC transporter permease [Clostridiales bacterium]|jgi:putative aldouronate transport system permease protein|nr:carbohydrate ABC transporter permease [Clostridiales bacterium]
MNTTAKKSGNPNNQFEALDGFILAVLLLLAAMIILPFISVIATSFATQKEYLEAKLLLFPRAPTIDNYYRLFQDPRIWVGYKTTIIFLLVGLPVNMFLTTSLAYGLSRPQFPGRKFFFFAILTTMMFNGGIVPMYLLMMQIKLTNTIWAVILASAVNSFYMIIMRTYLSNLPESLMESAKLDGASEWRILFQIVLPLSMPIIATIILFYGVDRWNEWFNPMIFIRKNDIVALQLVLRNIVIESRLTETMSISGPYEPSFQDGMKMCAVIVTMLPVMCLFPFLQKYFVKGVLIGAIKA